DVVELGVSYEGELGAVGLAASAVYVFSESGPGASDISDWAIGAQLAFGDFTVGGNYLHRDTEPDESWGATIGASYAMGSWSIAASYLYNEPASGDDIQVYGAGVSYTIAPGLTAAADIVGFDGDADGFA